MEPQSISVYTTEIKYAKGEESTPQDVFSRVAPAIAAPEAKPEEWADRFRERLGRDFVGAGRIMNAAGTELSATLVNCFVEPMADSSYQPENGVPSIYDALKEAAETMRRGGGEGYDFSPIRPKGAYVRKTGSTASGPLSYMEVFGSSCRTVESAGQRRGAQMGQLHVRHPDIWGFIWAKWNLPVLPMGQMDDGHPFRQFNFSVLVDHEFMAALDDGESIELTHPAQPDFATFPDAYKRDDGEWVYKTVPAQDLWDAIMQATYDVGEPGVIFIDRINNSNNLYYAEEIRSVNPCAEQPLPPYGACDLAPLLLPNFVENAFEESASFNWAGFKEAIPDAVRFLDNVLDVSYWPLDKQFNEAQNKRRIGLGFTGLGDTLIMLGLRYDSTEGRAMAQEIARVLRDEAYRASVELAKEKGPFPLFDAEQYLASEMAKQLPEGIRQGIAEHGLRNSHLTSIAPTGTVSLAFADNASNGIEPPFSWTYERKVQTEDGPITFEVRDHAFRVFTEGKGGDPANLPEQFVTALELGVDDHLQMLEAVNPFIDSSISKTVNIPWDYDFEDFKGIYRRAHAKGLKALATFRPNEKLGMVLDDGSSKEAEQPAVDQRLQLDRPDQSALRGMKWRKRPAFAAGNKSVTYAIRDVERKRVNFALDIGEDDQGAPFEINVKWEPPRNFAGIAMGLSALCRIGAYGLIQQVVEAFQKVNGDAVDVPMPPDGAVKGVPSPLAAFGAVVEHRFRELGYWDVADDPAVEAMVSQKEPKAGPDGTLAWATEVSNPTTEDSFSLFIKEFQDNEGHHWPFSVWATGRRVPEGLTGLAILWSHAMRVADHALIGLLLDETRNLAEAQGDFFAKVPGGEGSRSYPSTVAYVTELVLQRLRQLNLLDEANKPVEPAGLLETEDDNVVPLRSAGAMETAQARGSLCPECWNYTLVAHGGCEFCTNCGHQGDCG